MADTLLHIDSSIQGDRSISRRLSARAAAAWRAAHPDGTVVYRDLGANPLPHLDADGGLARMVPADQHTPAQAASWRLIGPGAIDPVTQEGLLGGRDLIVLASRGGGYGPGAPREGWDHAEQWLPHGLSLTGLEPRFITAELTLAETNPAMAELIPLMHESIAAAERAVDALWTPAVA